MQESKRMKYQAGANRTLYVNGRFLFQPPTGVQRYAMQLLRQWDLMLEEGEIDRARHHIVLLTPPGDTGMKPFQNIQQRPVGHLRGNLWEQIENVRSCRH